MNAIITERGNGLPDAGAYVPGTDGELYRVVALTGCIHTGRSPGAGNYVHATVEPADWDDCSEAEEFPASVEVDDDEVES